MRSSVCWQKPASFDPPGLQILMQNWPPPMNLRSRQDAPGDGWSARGDVLGPPADLVHVRTEGRRVHEAADRVPAAILAARVQLASQIAILPVQLRLVDEAGDHVVVVGLEELRAEQGAFGHDARAVALLRAPRDLVALRVGDRGVELGRRPEAEVGEIVEVRRLAQAVRPLGVWSARGHRGVACRGLTSVVELHRL
jgi:hypothetical protein